MTTHHTLLSLPLALSNIFRALTVHLSLSVAVYIYIYIYTSSNDNTPHPPLAPSLTYFKHLQHISLSLYALQALYK